MNNSVITQLGAIVTAEGSWQERAALGCKRLADAMRPLWDQPLRQ